MSRGYRVTYLPQGEDMIRRLTVAAAALALLAPLASATDAR